LSHSRSKHQIPLAVCICPIETVELVKAHWVSAEPRKLD